jgi:signal transduction histidine kinase/ActR/RegA family two-component response regulator
MADAVPVITPGGGDELRFQEERVVAFLKTLEVMAAGDIEQRLPISPEHDVLDAIAYAINVLVGELAWNNARAKAAQEAQAEELRAAVAAAERASAAKSIFLGNMSHEIKTPVAAMLGFADLLGGDLPEMARADLVRRLRINGEAVISILSDLLDLARLDANKIEVTPEQVSLIDVVSEVLASVEVQTRAKRLDVRVDFPIDALGTLRTDRFRLRQILVNLVANAVKFTSAGGIRVAAAVTRAADGDRWVVDITDTGIGIAPERHPFVFEPFEQGDPSIARTYGGVGLGLALSRRLAEQLGGSLLLLASVPGEGTTFRLTVKSLAAAPETRIPTAGRSPLPPAAALAGFHILLAEDHPDMRMAVRMLLEQSGASVETACDGREAVAKASASAFDVVLMDLRMPHMSGLEATRTLRAQGVATPIVALTADPAMMHRAEAIDSGCDECLSKPFLPRDLVAAIRFLRERKESAV